MKIASGSGSVQGATGRTKGSQRSDKASSSFTARHSEVIDRNDNFLSKWFRDKYGMSILEAKMTGEVAISVEDLIEASVGARRHELKYCRDRAEWAGAEALAAVLEKDF